MLYIKGPCALLDNDELGVGIPSRRSIHGRSVRVVLVCGMDGAARGEGRRGSSRSMVFCRPGDAKGATG